jgi:S1-C subfamily serine protease
VIVSPEGYILTNNHVIEGADEIEVTLSDSRRARAAVIGTDPELTWPSCVSSLIACQ